MPGFPTVTLLTLFLGMLPYLELTRWNLILWTGALTELVPRLPLGRPNDVIGSALSNLHFLSNVILNVCLNFPSILIGNDVLLDMSDPSEDPLHLVPLGRRISVMHTAGIFRRIAIPLCRRILSVPAGLNCGTNAKAVL